VNTKENLIGVFESLKKGDLDVFDKLYEEYYEKLCLYAFQYTSNKALIEDIVQEVFIQLWTSRKKIVIRTSLKSYLYKVVYNKLMDSYRIDKRKDKMLLSYYNTALTTIIDTIEDNDDLKKARLKNLDACIAELPDRCRKVFISKKISGLKYKQVSKELNISVKTVEGHVTRAFKLIRNCMKPKEAII